jgi:hypothetical protein
LEVLREEIEEARPSVFGLLAPISKFDNVKQNDFQYARDL